MKRPHLRLAAAAAAVAALALTSACGGSGFSSSSPSASAGGGATAGVTLQMLIPAATDGETASVRKAAATWAAQSGNKVNIAIAKDQTQELSQALAGGTPPDLFYVDAAAFAALQKANALQPYFDQLPNKSDFYPNLVKAFTGPDGKRYCAPKDFSNLALEINTALWTKAGLTDKDIPQTWSQLETVAKKLTHPGQVGLTMNDTLDRVDAFMRQAGGTLLKSDRSAFEANSAANLTGLQYVQKLNKEGVLKFAKQLDASWGGEALGKQKAAMAIEGNWMVGGMQTDFPSIKYRIVPLPAGPKGRATLSFTQCWGIAQKSTHQSAAIDFVKFLTSTQQELAFTKGFGVMPSIASAKSGFVQQFPEQKAFADGTSYAEPPVSLSGFDAVQKDFDAKLVPMATGAADPKAMLTALQTNAAAALKAAG